MTTRIGLVLTAIAIMAAGGTFLYLEVNGRPPAHALAVAVAASPSPSRSASTVRQARQVAPKVTVANPGFLSWAMLDRRTGRVIGSTNLDAPGDTMSMIKVWLAADYLTTIDPKPTTKRIAELSRMIVDSDNAVATATYARNGGGVTIERMATTCSLTGSRPHDRWSTTEVTARDVALLGACIADGRAAGPWTKWLLTQMRHVRGEGDFGPRTLFSEPMRSSIAIKNGWFMRAEDKQWHVTCLAIGPTWTMSVLVRYPEKLGLAKGKRLCHDVAAQVLSH